ncbi:type IX secretion system protein PorD [Prevotella sp.]|uniref:type IX secretion system protein PorD n=1 Tax=Prevotella sp. TaxID=59823 RepID=UPI002F94D95B
MNRLGAFLLQLTLSVFLITLPYLTTSAQELQAKVVVNHAQIQGTDAAVFEELQSRITQFLNERRWTSLHFESKERIPCSFNITVSSYEKGSNLFTCKAVIQANRPVYNAAYATPIYHNTDNDFNFEYAPFDQLNFNPQAIDNQLTALLAYYAYLIIGIDLDSFSPMGGDDCLRSCMTIANNAQGLRTQGWKSFSDQRNRFAIINDYMDEGLRPLRQLQYEYHRFGLDNMAENSSRGRANISTALENHLKKSHADRPLSLWPQIWTDIKRDELVNIYQGHSTSKEKETIHDILLNINASQSNAWEKIMQ